MGDGEMAPKDFLLLAADQTCQVFVLNLAAHRDGGLRSDWPNLLSTESTKSAANRTDQIAQLGHGDGVVGNVGDDDIGCELGDRPRLLLVSVLRRQPRSPRLRLIASVLG